MRNTDKEAIFDKQSLSGLYLVGRVALLFPVLFSVFCLLSCKTQKADDIKKEELSVSQESKGFSPLAGLFLEKNEVGINTKDKTKLESESDTLKDIASEDIASGDITSEKVQVKGLLVGRGEEESLETEISVVEVVNRNAIDSQTVLSMYEEQKKELNRLVEDNRGLEHKLNKVLSKYEEKLVINKQLSYELAKSKTIISEKEKALNAYRDKNNGFVGFANLKEGDLSDSQVIIARLKQKNATLQQTIEELASVETTVVQIRHHNESLQSELKRQKAKGGQYKEKFLSEKGKRDKLDLLVLSLQQELEEQASCEQRLADILVELEWCKPEGIELIAKNTERSGERDSAELRYVPDGLDVVEVIVNKANLREGPGKSNSPVHQVPRGTKLTVETKQGHWLRVIGPTGGRVFIHEALVQPLQREGMSAASSSSRARARLSRTRVEGQVQSGSEDERAAFELMRGKLGKRQSSKSSAQPNNF